MQETLDNNTQQPDITPQATPSPEPVPEAAPPQPASPAYSYSPDVQESEPSSHDWIYSLIYYPFKIIIQIPKYIFKAVWEFFWRWYR